MKRDVWGEIICSKSGFIFVDVDGEFDPVNILQVCGACTVKGWESGMCMRRDLCQGNLFFLLLDTRVEYNKRIYPHREGAEGREGDEGCRIQ